MLYLLKSSLVAFPDSHNHSNELSFAIALGG